MGIDRPRGLEEAFVLQCMRLLNMARSWAKGTHLLYQGKIRFLHISIREHFWGSDFVKGRFGIL